MNKTLIALTLILATAFADLSNLDLSTTTLSSSVGTAFTGAASGEKVGSSLNYIGDFNWDGYPDYAIAGVTTTAYIVLGRSAARTAAVDLSVTGSYSTNGIIAITVTSGSSLVVGPAGDNNGDGYDDLLVGWPTSGGVGGSKTNVGIVFVVMGRTGTNAITLAAGTAAANADQLNAGVFVVRNTDTNDATGDALGTAVGCAGDLDGDGFDDAVFSMPMASGGGKVYVLRGKYLDTTVTAANAYVRKTNIEPNTLETANNVEGFVIVGETAIKIGRSLSAAGDVNNDGYPDLIIGAVDYAYIVYGSRTQATTPFASLNFATTPADLAKATKITGPTTAAAIGGFGTSVGAAGDLNNDGNDDVFVTAPSGTTGYTYIIWGKTMATHAKIPNVDASTATNLGSSGIIITGAATNDAFGTDADGVGDVNLDGIDDIVIGAPTTASTTPGKAYVIYGSTTLASFTVTSLSASSSGISINGKANGDKFGTTVSKGGNLNRDTSGISDFIIGAPSGSSTNGLVYEFYGVKKTVTTTTPTGSGFRLEASLLVLASFFVALIF